MDKLNNKKDDPGVEGGDGNQGETQRPQNNGNFAVTVADASAQRVVQDEA